MHIKDYLAEYASRADLYLDSFFDQKIKEVKDIGRKKEGVSVAQDMLRRYKKFSHGGKKLRGGLIQLGYEIANGKKADVLKASTSIEIVHSFLLMHDDIEDKDRIRRGALTIHKQYEQSYNAHYGISMGINMGDLGAYLGMEALLNSDLPESNKIKAAIYLSRLLQRVAFGQGLDVTYEKFVNLGEEDILEVHLHKTSTYTIGGPLKIGALLGDAPHSVVKAIESYGEPIGIAFQLRDDELGLFSDEKVIGKPVGGDIKEGKNTLLHVKAIELSKNKDKKFLIWAYGNKNITKKDLERVKEITIKTGALKYSQNLSQKLVKKGKKYIPQITKNKDLQKLLESVADFVITRNT